MLDRIRTAAKNDEGFTLIELLIVIVVLGILAGIVVFGVSTFKSDSTLAACKASLKTISVAADAYDAKTGGYPADITPLLSTSTVPGYLKATASPPEVGTLTFSATAHTVSSSVSGCTI